MCSGVVKALVLLLARFKGAEDIAALQALATDVKFICNDADIDEDEDAPEASVIETAALQLQAAGKDLES